jgi:hypothetical protein
VSPSRSSSSLRSETENGSLGRSFVGNDRHKAYFIAALIFVSVSGEISFML